MRQVTIRHAVSSLLASLMLFAVVAAQRPVPPVKPGLWEVRASMLDANGKETAPPEQAALANMPPEARARMTEMMKARGLSMPDANGVMRVCLTKETFESGRWQQMASDAGCTTNFSTQTSSTWKWHSSCPTLNSESDGETVFSNPESYRTSLKTTITAKDKTTTSTRIVQSKWLAAACGDVKPIDPNTLGSGRSSAPSPR
jgi:hypothetical protein